MGDIRNFLESFCFHNYNLANSNFTLCKEPDSTQVENREEEFSVASVSDYVVQKTYRMLNH